MKNTLILLLFLFSFTSAFSQFGIKGGANISNIATDEDNIEDLKSKIGFQLGAMVKINFTDFFAIQPELVYTRKGAKYEILGADVTSNMDYLDIPVVLVLKPRDVPISFHAGPQFSYLLQTNVKYENATGTYETIYKVDRDNFEDFDLGFVAGLGIHFGKAILEFRYTRGLKDIEKGTKIGDIEIKPASKHFNLQASLGILF